MKILSTILAPIVAIIVHATIVNMAVAQSTSPKLEGTFSDWSTYSRTEGREKICYALTKPTHKSPENVRHGDIYMLIANWKSGAASEQPSFIAGYPLKNTNPPMIRVGNARFPMYVNENEAFIEDNADERQLVRNMRAGSTMRVGAESARGTSVFYEFSLKGVTAALKKAQNACQ